jgi:hypothetical protein
LKKHRSWFDEGYSKIFDGRRKAKLQWLRDPSEINGDNLNNMRREASRHFWIRDSESLKEKIKELAKNSKNKNYKRPV